jgi:hypothetical protein
MNFKKFRVTEWYEALGIIAVLLLGVSSIIGLFLGIIYYWNLAIAWALNTIFGTTLPYDWSTVGALFVIQLVTNSIISGIKKSK